MQKLNRSDLLSLEQYHGQRAQIRAEVLAHKRNRKLPIGPNATLYFEDRKTIAYQVQEMLRTERIFESEGIQEELDAYNPLIPDGDNLKCTFMIEYADADERKVALAKMVGIEDQVWMQVDGFERVLAVADEDLERSKEDKTSSVHFLRFQFTPAMIAKLREGAALNAGIDHAAYPHVVKPVAPKIAASLRQDFS